MGVFENTILFSHKLFYGFPRKQIVQAQGVVILIQLWYIIIIAVTFHFCRWLCNPQIDTKTRKWAIEGLAYLTNDADVKDDFVEDEPALKAMFDLAKVWT